MTNLDWIVLFGTTFFIVAYGIWKSRKNDSSEDYLMAGHSLPWYTISLSVISTQASAITFLSAPGQAYTSGMSFILFYLGMPLAMVVVSAFFIPVYYRLKVYTAYEFLEQRFDVNVRLLTVFFFLIQRSLAAGVSIAAPSIIISALLGWNIFATNLVNGLIIVLYTVLGGSKAVSQTQKLQMIIILLGMAVAGYFVFLTFPKEVTITDAMYLSGASGKLNTMDFSFDWNNRYNFWSGLLGGFFLQLAYFGTDQSQVGRYLGGSSMTQSRWGLLFNGLFKMPMQFGILYIGVLLFVFYQFTMPPIFFNQHELAKVEQSPNADKFKAVQKDYEMAHEVRKMAAQAYLKSVKEKDVAKIQTDKEVYLESNKQLEATRKQSINLIKESNPEANTNDINYIFLSFVIKYLPAGLLGLLMCVIFAAAMSTAASELNALATTSVIDIYKRLINKKATDHHYVQVSKWLTLFWSIVAIFFAQLASQLGTLIEAVNQLGSLFYGSILGVFLLALFSKGISSKAVFIAALLGEIIVLYFYNFTQIAYLWYNLIGCLVVIVASIILSFFFNIIKPKN
jgi:solute:Na+ symporter, SSS family